MNLILICIVSLNVTFVDQTTYTKDYITSQNGNYKVVSSYVPGSETYQEEVSLFEHNRLVWKQKLEGKHHFYISNTGTSASVLHVGSDAILKFFNKNGILQRGIRISSSHGGNFTKDGKIFFFLSGTDGLSAYDQAGQELNNFSICHKYAISYDGSIVAVVNENKLTVYEHNTPLIEFIVPSIHVRSIVISDDGSVLALIDSQNLYIYDLIEGFEKFRSSIKKPKVLAMSSDGGLIVVAGEERHTTSHITVQLFNHDHDVVWKWSRVLEHEYDTVHRIDFPDDKYLYVYTTNDLFRFVVE